jgi:hypothetical protein
MFDKTHKNYSIWMNALDRLSKNNIRNNFAELSKRSADEQKDFFFWSNQLKRIEKEYDEEWPVSPCELCGCKRTLFYGNDQCMNIGKCKNAPTAFGG